MGLPTIAVPEYTLTIPSTKKEVKYRPFLVKEEKILLLAMESEELDFCGCKMSDRPPFCDGTHSWTKF